MPDLTEAAAILAPYITDQSAPGDHRLDALLTADRLHAAVAALVAARWGYLCAITGLDPGPDTGELELLYHFSSGADVLTLRVRIPRVNAAIDSLYDIVPASRLYEQEIREMLGVDMRGLPDTGLLFLPDDWPVGVYPLRKDAALN